MTDFEQESDKIWDKWRKGEISHDEVQTELDVLISKHFPSFVKQSDFFKRLEEEISNRVHDKIPMSSTFRDNANACFSKRASVETQIIKQDDFINFWLNASWLKKPSRDDEKTIKKLDVEDLTKYHVLIFRSLVDLAKNGYQDSEQCRKLHEFYKLTKKRMLKERILKNPKDAFNEFLEHRQTYKSKQEKLEEARKSGSFCPHCDSKNTFSNGNMYGCRDCKRSWRKHN